MKTAKCIRRLPRASLAFLAAALAMPFIALVAPFYAFAVSLTEEDGR